MFTQNGWEITMPQVLHQLYTVPRWAPLQCSAAVNVCVLEPDDGKTQEMERKKKEARKQVYEKGRQEERKTETLGEMGL